MVSLNFSRAIKAKSKLRAAMLEVIAKPFGTVSQDNGLFRINPYDEDTDEVPVPEET